MLNNFFIILVLLGGLFGCVHQTPAPDIQDSHRYQQQLATLHHWQLEGKIAVRHANTSDSAAVRWQQNDEHFDIFLSGPLGAGATRLTGTPRQLSIQNSREEKTSTADPEQLIEKHLGWTLPLEKLPLWIIGYSDNSKAVFNSDHTLASFEQNGWQVDYIRYQTVNQWLLPEKIILKHEDMQVTIFIKRWELY
jgi:outer membrane lipoprotein LolB